AEIVARACEVLHRHEQQFTGTRLQDLVEFQTRRMLAGLEVAFEAMSQEQQTNFLERIRAFVKSLPAEQQERVKRELGADELTDAILKKAIATGALEHTLQSRTSPGRKGATLVMLRTRPSDSGPRLASDGTSDALTGGVPRRSSSANVAKLRAPKRTSAQRRSILLAPRAPTRRP